MTAASTTSQRDDRIPWAAMAGIIATVTVFAVAQGLTYPLLSFILERQGTASGLIGLSGAMTPLGFIISAPVIPALSRRVGAARLATLCSILAAFTLIAIAGRQDVWAWMPLRFLLGFFANPLYVISETWLIAITPASRRGRIMGLYSSIVSAGFAVGPLSLGLSGTEGWAPFLIGIGAFLGCGLIVLVVAFRLPDMPGSGEAISVGGFLARRRCCCLRFSPPPPSSRFCSPCLPSMARHSAAPKAASLRLSPVSLPAMPCCRFCSGAWRNGSARRGPCYSASLLVFPAVCCWRQPSPPGSSGHSFSSGAASRSGSTPCR